MTYGAGVDRGGVAARPVLVLVTGPAGGGKTTLAHRLATSIGCPAVVRDEIKEGMSRGVAGFVAEIGDPLTRKTFDVFFDVLGVLLRAGVTVVAEAAFQDPVWRLGLGRWGGSAELDGLADVRVVRCAVAPEVALARVDRRRLSDPRRAAHADDSVSVESLASFVPISLPVPTLDVDTTDGYSPPLPAIVTFAARAAS